MDATHAHSPTSPAPLWLAMRRSLGGLVERRELLWQLARREVQARYRGSWLGVFWALLNPVLMLALYTYVFSVVFGSRWSANSPPGSVDFALAVFAGLIPFNLFSENLNAAPGLVLGNASYVKRVVFPLEVLPLARLLASLVQAGLSLLVLVAAIWWFRDVIPWTIVFAPLVIVPLVLLTLGCSLLLASLGVFVRDIGNVVHVAVSALMFLSPVFYPLSRPPESVRTVLAWNPLAPILESFRGVVLEGASPDWMAWMNMTCVSAGAALAGWIWFAKSKNAFADVL
jgi:lipopolysaccharide transport system permease protein